MYNMPTARDTSVPGTRNRDPVKLLRQWQIERLGNPGNPNLPVHDRARIPKKELLS